MPRRHRWVGSAPGRIAMSTLRANACLPVRSLALALAIGLIVAIPARAQYPFGGGFAYPGYGYSYPGLGYGYPGYGYGFSGLGYDGYGGYSNLGFGVGTV